MTIRKEDQKVMALALSKEDQKVMALNNIVMYLMNIDKSLKLIAAYLKKKWFWLLCINLLSPSEK